MWNNDITKEEFLDGVAKLYFDLNWTISRIANYLEQDVNYIRREVYKMQQVPPPNSDEVEREIEEKLARMREDLRR